MGGQAKGGVKWQAKQQCRVARIMTTEHPGTCAHQNLTWADESRSRMLFCTPMTSMIMMTTIATWMRTSAPMVAIECHLKRLTTVSAWGGESRVCVFVRVYVAFRHDGRGIRTETQVCPELTWAFPRSRTSFLRRFPRL